MALIKSCLASGTVADNMIVVIPNDQPNSVVAGVGTVTTTTLSSGMKGVANCMGKTTITCDQTMNWVGIASDGTATTLTEQATADVTNYDYVAFHRGTNASYTFTLS